MSQRIALCLLLLLFGLGLGAAHQPPRNTPPSLHELSMEVTALQILYQFRFTPEQMSKLQKLAPETAAEAGARPAVKASEGFRRALHDLRTALVSAKDEEQIAKLAESLDELRSAENPDLDDGIEMTEAARQQTPPVLRWLSARQVATHVAAYGDQFPDPYERLVEAMTRVRGLKEEQWKQARDDVSDDVARLVAGLDVDKAGEINDQVVQLLIQARALTDADFKKEQEDLRRLAKNIVGDIGPIEVLRHVVERSLAELLSNPRLLDALNARLKK
jgi:hypothetical protein